MDSYFDTAAQNYDEVFTFSEIGIRQRQMVYSFLKPRLEKWSNIFEVNCGTGEDAIWFAQKGKTVLATDISKAMIEHAQAKIQANAALNLQFKIGDVKDADNLPQGNLYDLVFSNFGGLNCLDPNELVQFLKLVKQKVLHQNGTIVLVLMSKGSIWESLFFIRKLQFKKAFRRWTNKALAVNVDGIEVPTYYYNPSFFNKLKDDFSISAIQTIGFFLPPSYLEPIFKRRIKILDLLYQWECHIKNTKRLAGFSDHYLIELKPR